MKYLIILLIITSQNIFCQSKYIRFYPEYENTFHISDNGKGVIKTFVKKRNSEKYDYNNINDITVNVSLKTSKNKRIYTTFSISVYDSLTNNLQDIYFNQELNFVSHLFNYDLSKVAFSIADQEGYFLGVVNLKDRKIDLFKNIRLNEYSDNSFVWLNNQVLLVMQEIESSRKGYNQEDSSGIFLSKLSSIDVLSGKIFNIDEGKFSSIYKIKNISGFYVKELRNNLSSFHPKIYLYVNNKFEILNILDKYTSIHDIYSEINGDSLIYLTISAGTSDCIIKYKISKGSILISEEVYCTDTNILTSKKIDKDRFYIVSGSLISGFNKIIYNVNDKWNEINKIDDNMNLLSENNERNEVIYYEKISNRNFNIYMQEIQSKNFKIFFKILSERDIVRVVNYDPIVYIENSDSGIYLNIKGKSYLVKQRYLDSGINERKISYNISDSLQSNEIIYYLENLDTLKKWPLIIDIYPIEYIEKNLKNGFIAHQKQNHITGFVPLTLDSILILSLPFIPIFRNSSDDYLFNELHKRIDSLLASMKYINFIDRSNIFIAGHSYGASCAALLATRTNLFKGAILKSGNYNRTMSPSGFQQEYQMLFERFEVYKNQSAIFFCDRLNSKLLLFHGQDDQRLTTNVFHSDVFYDYCKNLKKDVLYFRIKGEEHVFSSIDNILFTLEAVAQWVKN